MALRFFRSRIIILILFLTAAVVLLYWTFPLARNHIPGLAHHEHDRNLQGKQPRIRHPEWLEERKPNMHLENRRGIDDQVLDKRTLVMIKDLLRVPYIMDPDYQPSVCVRAVSLLTPQPRWFMERYKPGIKLFLDIDDLGHFMEIARHSLPFGYARQSRHMFTHIVTQPNFSKSNIRGFRKRKKCLRCAVVGSGGILKDSDAGRAIDNHDYVFRLGPALTSEQFQMDVGRKTTFYVFSPETMHINPSNPLAEDVNFIYAIFNTHDMIYAMSMLSGENPPPKTGQMGETINLLIPQLDTERLQIIHPDLFRYVVAEYFDWAPAKPSVGAMAVFLALHICDNVSVYGLVYDPQYDRYYFDEHLVESPHDLTNQQISEAKNEQRLWERLEREGALHMFKRGA